MAMGLLSKFFILSSLCILVSTGRSAAMTCSNPPKIQTKAIWLPHPTETPKAIILIGHGLNMRASAMDKLGTVLNQKGHFHTLRLTLSGHDGDTDAFKAVTHDRWQQDFFYQYCEARTQADFFHVPLYFVGFSLSGIVGLDSMEYENEVRFDRMALLAPPAAIWPLVHFMKLLRVLGRDHMIQSFAEPSYRANMDGTSVAAYLSMFESISAYRESQGKHSKIPTLIIMDPEDELVSLDGLKRLANDFNLSNDWNFLEVTNTDTKLKKSYHHFITDDVALGDQEFERLVKAIADHFLGL